MILGEGDTFGINRSFGAPKIKININFSKAMTMFCLGLHYNANGLLILKWIRNL